MAWQGDLWSHKVTIQYNSGTAVNSNRGYFEQFCATPMSSKAMSGPSATTVDPALGTALADWAELSNEYVVSELHVFGQRNLMIDNVITCIVHFLPWIRSTFLQNLQESHDAYQQKFSEYLVLQKKCSSGVNHQRYRLKAIQNMLRHVKPSSPDEEKELQNLEKDMMRRQAQITQACSLLSVFSVTEIIWELLISNK